MSLIDSCLVRRFITAESSAFAGFALGLIGGVLLDISLERFLCLLYCLYARCFRFGAETGTHLNTVSVRQARDILHAGVFTNRSYTRVIQHVVVTSSTAHMRMIY